MLLALAIRFFLGPALMGMSSYAIGMRGVLLKIAIVQVYSSSFFGRAIICNFEQFNHRNYD